MTGCYKNNLYVQQEWVDGSFLASSKVHTPDPRQDHPPIGQRLIIAWDFPKSLYRQDLHLVATVRLWDNTQEIFRCELDRKRDVIDLFFANEHGEQSGKILTYKVQVYNREGKEVSLWEHHLWTELIEVGT